MPSCSHCALESNDFDSLRSRLQLVESFIEESHYSVRLLNCPNCGSRFLSVFSEEIDWVDSEDPMQVSIVRLIEADEARVRALSPEYGFEGLNQLRIEGDLWTKTWPSGKPLSESKGHGSLFVYPHD